MQSIYKTLIALDAVVWHKGSASRVRRFSGFGPAITLVDTITNLRFLAAHNPRWFLYLPRYLAQIVRLQAKEVISALRLRPQ